MYVITGTSVASPVVAGAVCLLASTVPEPVRWQLLNPASMKQVGGQWLHRLGAHQRATVYTLMYVSGLTEAATCQSLVLGLALNIV
jgi:hypothetical protein